MAEAVRELPPELLEACGAAGRRFGVGGTIHPDDYIFWFIFNGAPDKRLAVTEYFEKGAETGAWLKELIGSVRSPDEPFALLDFASGYGRVTRHLPKLLPNAKVFGSDVHPQAVEFLRDMGLEAILSASQPEEFAPQQQFDIVFALSFFTHMPKRTWTRWLRALIDCLRPGGHLIFTTHGEPGLEVMRKGLGRELAFDPDGFWFEPTSEQADLSTAEYGATATSFGYVYAQLLTANARLRRFQQAGAGYQDLYIVQRAIGPDRPIVYAASVVIERMQSVVASTRQAWIAATVTNAGSDAWTNTETWIRFTFGGRLYPAADGGIDGEPIREFRTFLPGSVQPGESVAVSLMLELAGIPEGEYLLRLDVV
ncbi:MAG: class I SAM-dependent methyltransferase, partial [Alphaproteobacteria bacterium]|nr:class I SAM-dependent methyltransferase [Alphaproteobacteria bacterium]